MTNLWLRLTLAWYAFRFPSLATTIQEINGQLKKGTAMGIRGTPVISFWPMRPGWAWDEEGNRLDYVSSYQIREAIISHRKESQVA